MWYPDYLAGTIISTIIEALLFFIGLVINIKIVLSECKTRDTKTWQIQTVCSVSSTIFFAFDLLFSTISPYIPDLSQYTGDWFCHLATFIITYGIFIVTTNSIIISMMKYTLIVSPFKALEWGHDQIQRLFLAIYITIPSVMAVFAIAAKNFESYNYIRMCYGMKEEDMETNVWKRLFLCNLKEMGIDESANNHVQNSIQTVCVVQAVITFLLTSNIMEAFFYYKIFTKMKRFIYIFPFLTF